MASEAAGLLFREEDLLWNCYFTIPKTRETGCLGSVLRTATASPIAKQRFIDMMKGALTDMLDARGIPYTKWSEYQTPRSRAKPGPKPSVRTGTAGSHNDMSVLPHVGKESLDEDAGRLTEEKVDG